MSLRRLIRKIVPKEIRDNPIGQAALGAALGPAGFGVMSAGAAAATVGAMSGLATGSLSRGLTAGMAAYGGSAGLGALRGVEAGQGGIANLWNKASSGIGNMLGMGAPEATLTPTAQAAQTALGGTGPANLSLTGGAPSALTRTGRQGLQAPTAALLGNIQNATPAGTSQPVTGNIRTRTTMPSLMDMGRNVMEWANKNPGLAMMGLGALGSVVDGRREQPQTQGQVRDINIPTYQLLMNPTGQRSSGSGEVQHFTPQFVRMAEGGAVPDPTPQITQMYQDLLGRAPDAPGLAHQVNAVNQGTPLDQIRQNIYTSPESRRLVINPTFDNMTGDSRAAFDYLMGFQGGASGSSGGGASQERVHNVPVVVAVDPATGQAPAPAPAPAATTTTGGVPDGTRTNLITGERSERGGGNWNLGGSGNGSVSTGGGAEGASDGAGIRGFDGQRALESAGLAALGFGQHRLAQALAPGYALGARLLGGFTTDRAIDNISAEMASLPGSWGSAGAAGADPKGAKIGAVGAAGFGGTSRPGQADRGRNTGSTGGKSATGSAGMGGSSRPGGSDRGRNAGGKSSKGGPGGRGSSKSKAQGGIVTLAQGGAVPTLQEGSFVVPADVVSMIGNGSTDAGLRLLNDKINRHAGGGAVPLRGPGDGQSDDIPTTVEGKVPARVADGEAYISPDTVTRLGGGDLKRGTKRLYSMMDRVRRQAHGRTQQQRPVNIDKVL